jgi:hypothetical protein
MDNTLPGQKSHPHQFPGKASSNINPVGIQCAWFADEGSKNGDAGGSVHF